VTRISSGRPQAGASSAFGSARMSAQRRLLSATAEEMPGAFTIEELSSAAVARGASAGTATVYRAVAAMEASGWLERVGERDGSALFARCGAGSHHHHHVVCDGCGRIAATECPVAEQVIASAQTNGFVVTRHEVTLYGLCPDCARSGEGRR
jgi:Fur family ferric uptake transcriptional regulator